MTWEAQPIGSFCHTGSGGTPLRERGADFYGGSIPWIKSGELRENTITSSEESITELGLKLSSAKLVPAGALLVAMYGATVGRIAILGIEASTNQAICHIVPDRKIADSRYLFHALQTKLPHFVARSVGGAQPNISQQIIRDTQIPLPPLAEQRRIAAILDQAEDLRTKRRQALAKLDTLTQSLFLEMFGDTSRNLRGLPIHDLGSYLIFVTSGARGWADFYSSSGARFIRSLDVQMNYIGDADVAYVDPPENAEARRTQIREGDVLLTITGSRIGRVACTESDCEGAYISQHVAILRVDRAKIEPKFLSIFLGLETEGQRQISASQYGQTKPGLNFDQIRRFHVPIPTLKLQQEFLARIADAQGLKMMQSRSLQQLDALFCSLQHRAFDGEL